MPSIEVSKNMLEKLAGKTVNEKDFEIVKAEIDSIEKDKIKIDMSDTNRPDLWSVEGIARALRGYYGLSRGVPEIKIARGKNQIIVDKNIKAIRPFIAGFVAKNLKITEEFLIDVIQLQEKVAENYGRKRSKISIGVYDYKKIKFPVHYKAVNPDSVKFSPLEFDRPLTLKEILEKHPKGIQYGFILKYHNMYPIFVDSKEDVLSFPPIINSNFLGKIEPGISDVFIEITGTEMKHVLIATNILACALYDRGAELESVNVKYPWITEYGKSVATPVIFRQKMQFHKREIKKMLGIELGDKEVKELLEKMQYDASVKSGTISVVVPPYRNDVMHSADVIEDIAIAYGYDKIEPLETRSQTLGSLKPATLFAERARCTMAGLGFQEVLSQILSSRSMLSEKMECDEKNIVEIENYMSENYSAVRSWILPSLLGFLSRNLHVDYPQKIFEYGECVVLEGEEARTTTRMSACFSDTAAGYEDISSALHAFMQSIGIAYKLEAFPHPSFIDGRTAKIIVNTGGGVSQIGFIGEVHPQVLNNFGLEKPVVAFELDLEKIFK
jgi:phenylalanyl-tRNA synthetase beta chain